jgi:hypothetical protein
MRYITKTSKSIFDGLQETEREICTVDIIEHIILLYIEFKADYEGNIFDKSEHPELYWHGEGISINEYISFIENELQKDKISIHTDLLTKIIYSIRKYNDLYS